jgi:DNA-binding XRE family transcriptional regulator
MKDCDHDALSSIIDAFTFKTTKARKRKKTNVIPFKRSRGSAAKMRARLRSMHGQKIVSAQLLAFPLSSGNHVIPVIRGDTPALPPLADLPMTRPNIGREVGMGGPKTEQILKGHRDVISLDTLSSKGPTSHPVTEAEQERTICPMSKATPRARFQKEFCHRLKTAREFRDLTQEEMAKKLGVLANTYSTYERRSPMPHYLVLQACEILGISTDHLYGLDKTAEKAA